jgi:hypothetical protein
MRRFSVKIAWKLPVPDIQYWKNEKLQPFESSELSLMKVKQNNQMRKSAQRLPLTGLIRIYEPQSKF